MKEHVRRGWADLDDGSTAVYLISVFGLRLI